MQIIKFIVSTCSAFVFSTAFSFGAAAAPITAPTDLNPGDEYRLAFVTSTTRDATSSNIADYNTFVSNAANAVNELAALGTQWFAIASTVDVDARDNTGTNPSLTGVPIYLLNDTRLADNNQDLWNGLFDNPLNLTEQGLPHTGSPFTWTGSTFAGVAHPTLALGGPIVRRGLINNVFIGWMEDTPEPSHLRQSIYALSGILTVSGPSISAPEPAPLAVLAFGLIAVAVVRRRWRAV